MSVYHAASADRVEFFDEAHVFQHLDHPCAAAAAKLELLIAEPDMYGGAIIVWDLQFAAVAERREHGASVADAGPTPSCGTGARVLQSAGALDLLACSSRILEGECTRSGRGGDHGFRVADCSGR